MRVTFFVFRKNKKPPSKKLKATQNKRFHGSMALSPSTMLQTQFSKKNDYQPIQLFQQSVQKNEKDCCWKTFSWSTKNFWSTTQSATTRISFSVFCEHSNMSPCYRFLGIANRHLTPYFRQRATPLPHACSAHYVRSLKSNSQIVRSISFLVNTK